MDTRWYLGKRFDDEICAIVGDVSNWTQHLERTTGERYAEAEYHRFQLSEFAILRDNGVRISGLDGLRQMIKPKQGSRHAGNSSAVERGPLMSSHQVASTAAEAIVVTLSFGSSHGATGVASYVTESTAPGFGSTAATGVDRRAITDEDINADRIESARPASATCFQIVPEQYSCSIAYVLLGNFIVRHWQC